MVAYSFQSRFVDAIRLGTKTQTIRGPRARHARPGERVQLYRAMRTKHCAKIVPDPLVIRVEPVRIWRPALHRIEAIQVGDTRLASIALLDEFAIRDGFHDLADMEAWWIDTHDPGDFVGVLIRWVFTPGEEASAPAEEMAA